MTTRPLPAMPDCPDLPPLPAHDPTHAAVVLWIAVGVVIIAFLVADALIYWHGRRTMSQTSQAYLRAHHWLQLLAGAVLGLLGWHLLRGFPW